MTLTTAGPKVSKLPVGLPLLILWCVAVLAFLLLGTGAIWLRVWGPALVRAYHIPSTSMLPTLQIEDRVLVALHTVQQPDPRRGDIVFYRHRRSGNVHVHRIIGLPGDSIQLVSGRLHLNGSPVPRKRVEDFSTVDIRGKPISVPHYRETLPGGTSYFVLEQEGDRGFLDNTELMRVPEGRVFVLGDNRDNSMDSRDSKEMGPIPIADILGYPALTLWSRHEGRAGSVPR